MTHPPQPTSRRSISQQSRPHSRAVRSMRTSTALYSVPEANSRSSLHVAPVIPPKSSKRISTQAKPPNQLNTHLEHLFGAPQCHNQKDSIETLTDSYGMLAWNPEELERTPGSISGSSATSGRSKNSSRSHTERSPLPLSPRSGGCSGHGRKPSSPLKTCEKALGW